MPRYWVTIHRPSLYDGTTEDQAMHDAIDVLNKEMVASGIRVFVGGLASERKAKSIRTDAHGRATITDGPYLKASEHVGGFWVIEADNIEEALEWGRKASIACKAPVEVRQIF